MMDWLERLREHDPEAAAIIDEWHRQEAIGFASLRDRGLLHPTPIGGMWGASWGECQAEYRRLNGLT